MGSLSTEELLRKLDEHHQAYIKTFRLVHEALAQSQSGERRQEFGTGPSSNSITTLPVSPPSPGPHISLALPTSPQSRAPSRRRRRSTEVGDFDRPLRRPGTFQSSVYTGDSDESELDGDLYVQDALPSYSYDLEDLRQHLKTYKFEDAGTTLLKTVVKNGRLKHPGLFREYPDSEKWHNSHYSVFDVDQDGTPLSRFDLVQPGTTSIDSAIWQVVQDLNAKADSKVASGRITIVREPSPLIFGALHMTMSQDFDMDEIFRLLVTEACSSAQMANRAFKEDERQQRSFIFNFDYYTVVGDEVQPMPWQRTDKPEKQKKKFERHIQISRCSSIVALSLHGGNAKRLKSSARRSKTKEGLVHDPWAAWNVLNIQCYPDHKHSMDSHDSTKHYVNGPEAFMHTLLAELKDAEKRFRDINMRITKLITPEADFMFDGSLRDKLLFEDQDFTYSRRYFWAYQTLGIMMNSIKDIIDACNETFTEEFWEGRHKTLWPMFEYESARNIYWRKRMSVLRKGFDRQLKMLAKAFDENDDRRKEIRTLRDQLFSGTSVLESRKSVELSEVTILQGHNVKLLTLVSIFFLPLTFVTSVFGMSNMPTEHEFNIFGIVMTTVCVPFFFLIGSLNTTQGMRFWRSRYHAVIAKVFSRKIKGDETIDGKSDKDDQSENEERAPPPKMHKRTHSANISIEKRKGQLKPLAKPEMTPMPEKMNAITTALDSKESSMTIQSRTNSDIVSKAESGAKNTVPVSQTTIPRQGSMPPVIVHVSVPAEEADRGSRRIEGVEKRIIDVGLRIPSVNDAASDSSWTARGREPRPRSIAADQVEEQEMWWSRLTGRQRKVSKTRLDV